MLVVSAKIMAHGVLDALAPYRQNEPQAFVAKPRALDYYSQAEKLIASKLRLELSRKEAAILAGLYWLIGFVDKDSNFNSLASNFLLLLHEMTFSKERKHQREVAQMILKTSLACARSRLQDMYPRSLEGAWEFIALLPIIEQYPEFKPSYHEFYNKQFATLKKGEFEDDNNNYNTAIQNKNYSDIYNYLISTSFLYYYLQVTKAPIKGLPKDYFQEALIKLEPLEYDPNISLQDPNFIQLGYLATHVLLVLTNYGQHHIKDSVNMRNAARYIRDTLDKVRYELGYLDLLAEYVQCLKIIDPSDTNITSLDNLLFDLQRSDGSWGLKQSFPADPYTVFHPTWAVLTALNQ